MTIAQRRRRARAVVGTLLTVLLAASIFVLQPMTPAPPTNHEPQVTEAQAALPGLEVKGRAPKTDYARSQFGSGWIAEGGCDTRNRILQRDLTAIRLEGSCTVLAGTLHDPYSGLTLQFQRGAATSSLVQIDHVVALSDAWQKGAQQLGVEQRIQLANDPLNLLAVQGQANQQKSDSDAASWLPANRAFRCQYVARQVLVKAKYQLWVTAAEKQVMNKTLDDCVFSS